MRPLARDASREGIPARFRRLRAGDRGLIAAPWTPLASLCFPFLKEEKESRPGPAG